jgi:hypothetical protein
VIGERAENGARFGDVLDEEFVGEVGEQRVQDFAEASRGRDAVAIGSLYCTNCQVYPFDSCPRRNGRDQHRLIEIAHNLPAAQPGAARPRSNCRQLYTSGVAASRGPVSVLPTWIRLFLPYCRPHRVPDDFGIGEPYSGTPESCRFCP